MSEISLTSDTVAHLAWRMHHLNTHKTDNCKHHETHCMALDIQAGPLSIVLKMRCINCDQVLETQHRSAQ